MQVAAADDDWEDELAQAPPASELPPPDSLGLSGWMNTLRAYDAKARDLWHTTPISSSATPSKGVITVKANRFGLFGGLSGRASTWDRRGADKPPSTRRPRRQEDARAAMLADPPRYGFGTSS